MKLSLLSALSLSLLLFDAHFSLGRKSGKSSSSKTSTSSNSGKTQTSTKTDSRNHQGSVSEDEYPKQHGPPGQGGNTLGGGGYGHGGYGGGYGSHGGYGHGGYGGGYGGHGYGGYGSGGYRPGNGGSDVGGVGSYGDGYTNQNRILSPHYGNSFGYGGRGGRGGSPFYRKVKAVGVSPSDKSKGFGRTAAMAASGGVVAKMAVDYGLGRFPRPHFQFQSPEEEYYYNHYMYTIYGVKSTDANDYSRDYSYSHPLENYERHMNTCVKTIELLPEDNHQKSNKPALHLSTRLLLVSNNDTDNKTAANSSSSLSPQNHPSQTEAKPVSPTSQIPSGAAAAVERDDDTVSIVETGYPALIKMIKVRKCLKIYIVNSEKYLEAIGGAQRLEPGCQMALAAVTSALLMLLNSSMLQ